MVDYKKLQTTFARALFDNVAEMVRELSFKKGDILTVLQEKYENNPEWWVCSLRNMVGLAPANRLEAMPVLVQNKAALQSQLSASTYDELPEQSVGGHSYANLNPGVNTTLPFDDTYSTYQLPNEDVYVDPLSVYQMPAGNIFDETYSSTVETTAFKSNSNTLEDNTFKSEASKEFMANEYYNNRYDYSDSFSDTTSTSLTASSIHSTNQFSITSSDSSDFRSLPKDSAAQLQISPEEAILRYRQLQTDMTAICNKVIEFAKAKWKSEEVLKSTVNLLRQCFIELQSNLAVLVAFVAGVYQNSLNCADSNLTKKIGKQMSPLEESKQTIKESLEKLGTMGWDPEKIATSVRLAVSDGSDALGQVISSARNVLINTRSLSVTINGNANILFSTNSVMLSGGNTDTGNTGLSFRTAVTGGNNINGSLQMQSVLKLFLVQIDSQVELVNVTVDDFLAVVDNRNHDSHFQDTVTSNSKFVVRTATQLVCIAKNLSDTNLIKLGPAEQIEEAGNRLCDSLKSMINLMKQLIGERQRWSTDQKDQLSRQLKTIRFNVNSLQRVVTSAMS